MPTAPRWFPAWRHAWVRVLVWCGGLLLAWLALIYTLQALFGTTVARNWGARVVMIGLGAVFLYAIYDITFGAWKRRKK